jgi:hypothetical protein
MEKNFSNSLEKLDSNPRTDNDSETHPIIKRVYKPVSIWKALKSETLAISLSASSLFCIERSWWCDRPENKKYMESFSYLARRTESYLKQLDAPRKKRKRPLIARLFFPKID